MILVLLVEQPYFQIQALLYLQTAYLIYLGLRRPLKSRVDNNFELMNESLLLVQIYHIIWFSDFVNDPMFKHRAGWSSVAVTLVQICINVARMAIVSVKNSYKSWRHSRFTRAELKRAHQDSFY